MSLPLARHVLDKEILDCDGFKGGKVDDLLLELRGNEPPVVASIVTQHGALIHRFPRLAHMVNRLLRRPALAEPVYIPWDSVERIDVTVHISQRRGEAHLMHFEISVWERVISHLPFARR